MLRQLSLAVVSLALGACAQAHAATVSVIKDPHCGCCTEWVEHMRAAGFTVEVTESTEQPAQSTRLGVPEDLRGCHTATVDGYVIEGHVPAADVRRLLAERPAAVGLAVPGMPLGSPGMEQGGRSEPYASVLFDARSARVFERH